MKPELLMILAGPLNCRNILKLNPESISMSFLQIGFMDRVFHPTISNGGRNRIPLSSGSTRLNPILQYLILKCRCQSGHFRMVIQLAWSCKTQIRTNAFHFMLAMYISTHFNLILSDGY